MICDRPGIILTCEIERLYNDGNEKHCDKRLTSEVKSYLKRRQPSLCRVAVVAFYANCDGKTKHMKSQRNGHAHHLLSENDGQPPAL